MFLKHLPPSRELPRVLALDPRAAAELAGSAEVTLAGADDPQPDSRFDAIVGPCPPEALPRLAQYLRPGGRAILTSAAEPEALLRALEQAGFIHCLVETAGDVTLYRGERPPIGSPVERVRAAAGSSATGALSLVTPGEIVSPYVFLLVTQTPNKPAWKLGPDERVTWQAATIRPADDGMPALLAFSSLLKAVAFMQAAILAGAIAGVNKVGKFPAQAAHDWPARLALNPAFDSVKGLVAGPALELDPRTAITGDE
jgi:hypothetical protein